MTTLPPHILNAPTPLTDANIQHETNKQGIGFQFVSVNDSGHLERLCIWQQEVIEKLESMTEHTERCLNDRDFRHNNCTCNLGIALTECTQLKQYIDKMKKGTK